MSAQPKVVGTDAAAPAAVPASVIRTAPAGRYGADPAKRDRRIRRAYVVTVVLAVALVAVLGGSYLLKSPVNGEVVSFQVVSATQVQIQLQVSKPADKAGSCTVRSRDTNGNEVGRVTVPLPAKPSTYVTVVNLRTSARGTTGELVSCG